MRKELRKKILFVLSKIKKESKKKNPDSRIFKICGAALQYHGHLIEESNNGKSEQG